MKKISWKKGLFSSTYKLYDDNNKVGEFRQSAFSRSSVGNINGTQLTFKKKGVFSSETEVRDMNSNEFIGTIKFNSWGNKAEITVDQKKYQWKYDNFWSTRWRVSENQQPLITYKSSTTKGKIESSVDSDVLLLCGLFVHNHYLTLMIVITVSTAVILSGS
jgi:hypothetical protein